MIFQKLLELQKTTKSLAPNATGQTGAAKYQYVTGSKLLDYIRPQMDRLGIILSQEIIDITNVPITYSTMKGEKTETFTTCKFRFTWIDTEDSSTFSNEFAANGMNAWDKGLGSALTYAERYYLMKFFHIATDIDDVDALIKDEAIKARPQARKAQAPTPTRISNEQYWKMIENFANGVLAKDGSDYRQAWIKATNATAEQIASFDHDVENYKIATQQK